MFDWKCSRCGTANSTDPAYMVAGGGLDCAECGYIENPETTAPVVVTFDIELCGNVGWNGVCELPKEHQEPCEFFCL